MLLRSRAVEKLSQLKRVADRDTRAEQRIEVGDVGLGLWSMVLSRVARAGAEAEGAERGGRIRVACY